MPEALVKSAGQKRSSKALVKSDDVTGSGVNRFSDDLRAVSCLVGDHRTLVEPVGTFHNAERAVVDIERLEITGGADTGDIQIAVPVPSGATRGIGCPWPGWDSRPPREVRRQVGPVREGADSPASCRTSSERNGIRCRRGLPWLTSPERRCRPGRLWISSVNGPGSKKRRRSTKPDVTNSAMHRSSNTIRLRRALSPAVLRRPGHRRRARSRHSSTSAAGRPPAGRRYPCDAAARKSRSHRRG